MIQNQLTDFDGQTGNLVKQEISEENPASVTSSVTSGNMSVSGQNEEQTVIPQRDHEDDQNMVGQGSSDENILNQAAIQKALIQAVGVKNGNVISTSLIPSMSLYSILRVVWTHAILFMKTMSERGGSDIQRP